jgi:hypothetical protein
VEVNVPVLAEKPIQVYLEERQDRALRQIAEKRGIPLSTLIRDSVDAWLLQLTPDADPAMDVIGLGASGVGDLGSAHDEHLASALAEEVDRSDG